MTAAIERFCDRIDIDCFRPKMYAVLPLWGFNEEQPNFDRRQVTGQRDKRILIATFQTQVTK